MAARRPEGTALLVAGHGAFGALDRSALHTLGQIGEALLATGTAWQIRRLASAAGERLAPDRGALKQHLDQLSSEAARAAVLVVVGSIITVGGEPALVTGGQVRDYPEDATLPLRWIRDRLRAARAEQLVAVVSARSDTDDAPGRWLSALGTGRAPHVVAVAGSRDDDHPIVEALLTALCGDALDSRTGTVTMASLSTYLARHAGAAVQASETSETLAQPPPFAGLWDVRRSQASLRQTRPRSGDDDEDLTGTVLPGRFRIDAVIARGTFGTVYRARQLAVERDVAIKVLHADIDPASDDGRLFVHEIRSVGRLDHGNVVRIYQADITHDGRLFFAMELLAGRDLQEVGRSGPLPAARAIELVRQLLAGLGAAHDAGLVHADVKPANAIVVERDGVERVVLVDFGLARLRAPDHPTESAGGTPAYMAPEQMHLGRIDARSDLFSAALVLVYLLTGWRRPNPYTPTPPLGDHLRPRPARRAGALAGARARPALRQRARADLGADRRHRAAGARGPGDAAGAVPPARAVHRGRPRPAVRPGGRSRRGHAARAVPPQRHLHGAVGHRQDLAAPRGPGAAAGGARRARGVPAVPPPTRPPRSPPRSGRTRRSTRGSTPRSTRGPRPTRCARTSCRPPAARAAPANEAANEAANETSAIAAAITAWHRQRGGKLVIILDQVEAALGDDRPGRRRARLRRLAGRRRRLRSCSRSARTTSRACSPAPRRSSPASRWSGCRRWAPTARAPRSPARSPRRGSRSSPRCSTRCSPTCSAPPPRSAPRWAGAPRRRCSRRTSSSRARCSCEALDPGDAMLTLAHYQRLGGFDAIVGEHLERVLDTELTDGSDRIARALFVALVTASHERAMRAESELIAMVGDADAGSASCWRSCARAAWSSGCAATTASRAGSSPTTASCRASWPGSTRAIWRAAARSSWCATTCGDRAPTRRACSAATSCASSGPTGPRSPSSTPSGGAAPAGEPWSPSRLVARSRQLVRRQVARSRRWSRSRSRCRATAATSSHLASMRQDRETALKRGTSAGSCCRCEPFDWDPVGPARGPGRSAPGSRSSWELHSLDGEDDHGRAR